MAEKKKLGRGLEALLGRVGGGLLTQESDDQEFAGISDVNIPVSSVDIMLIDRNPHQPRRQFDEAELDQLAASLQTHGLLQPIVVRRVGERFQIIAGERRFRAAMRAGWSEVTVHCLTVDDRQMSEIALTENLHRKDLNAIEKAASFADYLEKYGGTHEELAKRLELNRATVTNLLRLLELPQELQDAVQCEKLSSGHVRALLSLKDEDKLEIADRIQSEGWSVRETENYVRERSQNGQSASSSNDWNVVGQDGKTRSANCQSEQVVQLEQNFRERLGGMKVKLTQTNEKGKGKLVISFANHAEFERIYTVICKSSGKVTA